MAIGDFNLERYEVYKTLEKFEQSIDDIRTKLNPDKLNETLETLNQKMQASDFWSFPDEARKVSQEATQIRRKLDIILKLEQDYKSIVDWFEISEESTEEWEILEKDISTLRKEISDFELEVILNEPHDYNDAIMEIHAGAGGTEAQDWCEMLFRMYQRYAQNKNYKFEIIDYLSGDEAGIKSVTFSIRGPHAYGYLKAEKGVHRLVRISPFDSNARRHTSFASVDVMPEIDDDIQIEVKDSDIKIDVYRSSGAGGQSVNTTDSAVRITHLATNIVVTCQNERSQIKNRETAMKLLKTKLLQLELEKQAEKLSAIQGEQKDIAWGSQIRSYVFHPYQMVKDHRTNFEVSQVNDVMDGDIDGFINAYLKQGR